MAGLPGRRRPRRGGALPRWRGRSRRSRPRSTGHRPGGTSGRPGPRWRCWCCWWRWRSGPIQPEAPGPWRPQQQAARCPGLVGPPRGRSPRRRRRRRRARRDPRRWGRSRSAGPRRSVSGRPRGDQRGDPRRQPRSRSVPGLTTPPIFGKTGSVCDFPGECFCAWRVRRSRPLTPSGRGAIRWRPKRFFSRERCSGAREDGRMPAPASRRRWRTRRP
jgi:hypothetical protein